MIDADTGPPDANADIEQETALAVSLDQLYVALMD